MAFFHICDPLRLESQTAKTNEYGVEAMRDQDLPQEKTGPKGRTPSPTLAANTFAVGPGPGDNSISPILISIFYVGSNTKANQSFIVIRCFLQGVFQKKMVNSKRIFQTCPRFLKRRLGPTVKRLMLLQ